ncbi:MAG: RNA 2',3'-cyclic phosphodiesterase [bacterium]
MSKIRTFIAVEIPQQVRQNIAAVQNAFKKEQDHLRWTKPDNIHLTLKFLGDVEEDKIEAIADAVDTGAQSLVAFNCLVEELGAFPNFNRARVLWVGITDPQNQLTNLAQKIDHELGKMGFPREKRKFSPHLTIARVKSRLSENFVARLQQEAFHGGEVRVAEIVVVKSDLKPRGAEYTVLKRIRLRD